MENTRKKIALYHPWIYLKGGAERVILEIANRSKHDFVLFTSHYDRERTFPEFKDLNINELKKVSVNRKYNKVASSAMKIITQKVNLDNFDALLISSEGLGDFFTFRNHGLPVFCFCHTPLKIIHDPVTKTKYLHDNRCTLPKYLISSAIFKMIDKIAWSNYRFIICNSNETRKRILKAKLAPDNRIMVNHPGIDLEKLKPVWKYKKYFLIPGRIAWYKNVELGIEAFKQFNSKGLNKNSFNLVVAGMVDEKSKTYFEKLKKLVGGAENIKLIRDPSDPELFELYSKCYSVILTALNEDWGIVPIEAMSFGKSVISVNKGGPTESIIHGKTGYLVESTVEEFVKHINILSNSI